MTASEANRILKKANPPQNKEYGVIITDAEVESLCYLGPCDDNGNRTICYRTDTGCDNCFLTSEGCTVTSVDALGLTKVEFAIDGVIGQSDQVWDRTFSGIIKDILNVQFSGALGSLRYSGKGSDTLVLIFSASGIIGDGYRLRGSCQVLF
jgi:hypothetical protein